MARQKISEIELNQLAVRGSKIKRRSSAVPTPAEVAAAEPTLPEPDRYDLPMANIAAVRAALNSQISEVAESNRRSIEDVRAELKRKPDRKGLELKIYRNGPGLIDRVVSSTGWVFQFNRIDGRLIDTIDVSYAS